MSFGFFDWNDWLADNLFSILTIYSVPLGCKSVDAARLIHLSVMFVFLAFLKKTPGLKKKVAVTDDLQIWLSDE